jgi:naringenin degradation protein FdeH
MTKSPICGEEGSRRRIGSDQGEVGRGCRYFSQAYDEGSIPFTRSSSSCREAAGIQPQWPRRRAFGATKATMTQESPQDPPGADRREAQAGGEPGAATPVRRVVTGHREDGRSTVLMDAVAGNVKQRRAGNASTLLWVTDESPADVSARVDRAAREIGVPPPPGGTLFRVVEFPPNTGGVVRDHAAVLRDFGIGADVAPGHPPRHPAIHRTRTVDYVVVLEGEIDLLLDDAEVHLCAGDVVIQQGTNHAWINRAARGCRLAMVFVDAAEPDAIRRLNAT